MRGTKGVLIVLALASVCMARMNTSHPATRTLSATPPTSASSTPPPLNIFILAHSHCDPGWLATFEGYFQQSVNGILTEVTRALQQNPKRRFVWAEISFFSRWYDAQSADVRSDVEALVESGQLEFVEGGWVQADEADTNYVSIINQVAEGHAYLRRHFGVRPRFAYQIDPFGHSSATPALFARMGFEGLVINRIHWALKAKFKQDKHMEFVWRGAPGTLDAASDILTHVLHTHYSAPKGFDFEEASIPISPSNVASRARVLVSDLRSRAAAYATSNLLVPFGDDFKFRRARYQFENMEQLIAHISDSDEYPDVTIRFATLSEYFDALTAEAVSAGTVFPRYDADFFPYADNEDSYWTGYYTTRPVLKQLARATEATLRAAELAYVFARTRAAALGAPPSPLWATGMDALVDARRQSALVQHHDGITGTAKQHVVADYTQRLLTARDGLHATLAAATATSLARSLPLPTDAPALTLDPHPLHARVLSFPPGPPTSFAVPVSSSLSWPTTRPVTLITSSPNVRVERPDGSVPPFHVVPHFADAAYAPSPHAAGSARPPAGGSAGAFDIEPVSGRYELVFLAQLDPLATAVYFVVGGGDTPSALSTATVDVYSSAAKIATDVEEGVDGIVYHSAVPASLELAGTDAVAVLTNGLLASINGRPAALSFNAYRSPRSGAYIFRATAPPTPLSPPAWHLRVVRSPVHIAATVAYGAVAYSVRVLAAPEAAGSVEAQMVELDVSAAAGSNEELSLRLATDIASDAAFFSDSSLQLMPREAHRAKAIHTNVFPCLSVGAVADDHSALAVLSTQPRGVTSPSSGALELFLHRNLLQDDGRGLAEPPRDSARYATVMWLALGSRDKVLAGARSWAHLLEHPPFALATAQSGSREEWEASFATAAAHMPSPGLPPPLHLLSLKAVDAASDDVVVQIAALGQAGTGAPALSPMLDRLFAIDGARVAVSAVRRATLAGEAFVPGRPRTAVGAKLAGARDASLSLEDLVASGAGGPGESQNTDEAGVFISQAALADKANSDAANAPTRRRLAALDAPEGFELAELQVASFLVHLAVSSDASSDAPSPRPAPTPRPTPRPKPTRSPTPPPTPVSPVGDRDARPAPTRSPVPTPAPSTPSPAPSPAPTKLKIGKQVGVNFDSHKTHPSFLVQEVYVMFVCWGVSALILLVVYLKLRYGCSDRPSTSLHEL